MRYLFFTLFVYFLFASSSYAAVLDNCIKQASIISVEKVVYNEGYNLPAPAPVYYADRRPAPPAPSYNIQVRPAPPPPHRHDVDRRPAPPPPPPPHRHDVDRRPAPPPHRYDVDRYPAPSYNIQVRPAPPAPRR